MSVCEILEHAKLLKPYDQLQLLEKLKILIHNIEEGLSQHSIIELRGLGKLIWQDKDAQKYVEQEHRGVEN
ncbi:MAG: hypothetical protein HQM13_10045 [SAR324 cluster bacterium]|nr:hypothetical protein [SAR324 cluster bacterium]